MACRGDTAHTPETPMCNSSPHSSPGQVLASLPRMPSSTQQTPTHLSCPSPCPRPLTSRLEAPTPCPALSLLERLLRPRLTRARPVAQTCAPSAFARAGHRPCRREAGSRSSGPGARSAQSSPALWLSRTRPWAGWEEPAPAARRWEAPRRAQEGPDLPSRWLFPGTHVFIRHRASDHVTTL